MNSHHGQTLERIIRRGGYSLSQVARLVDVNRRTIYNWFNQQWIKPEVLYQLGQAIKHDFSVEFPQYFTATDFTIKKKAISLDDNYEVPTTSADEQCFKEKYQSLEQRYFRLVEAGAKMEESAA